MSTSLVNRHGAGSRTRRTRPLLLVIGGGMIGAALVIGWAGSALRTAVTVDWGKEPQLIVSVWDPGSGVEDEVEAIPGVAAVVPATDGDLASMGVDEETGWNLFQARTVIVEEGADFEEIEHRVSAISGLDGYVVRDQEHQEQVTWVRPGASGGSVTLSEAKLAFVTALTTWVWPVLLLAGIGLSVYGLGVIRTRRLRDTGRPPDAT